ncbi:cupredoxin domain-containing protein [Candidatus Woesearchaeota archaeon]|nr:cupredoxin domain-containing protein [Candidatus Woesearchaeota archaeon]
MKKLILVFMLLIVSLILLGCTEEQKVDSAVKKTIPSQPVQPVQNNEGQRIVVNDNINSNNQEKNTEGSSGSIVKTVGSDSVQPNVKDFEVHGKNFEYDIKEIRVKKGDTVRIKFTSDIGFHDWVVNEFNARTEKVRDGGTTSTEFIADKTGEFEYYCSVGSHKSQGMIGKIIVED